MKLSIQNMKCSGCVATVTDTLKELTGSISIEVDLEAATAEIDVMNDPDAVIAALTTKGFPASVI
jgi:copper chaperone CopZ